MKRGTLILLTAGFPYGRGEPFLEAEIPHLAAAFEKVHLLCEVESPLPETMRAVPANVFVSVVDANGERNGSVESGTCSIGILASELLDCLRNYKVLPKRSAWRVLRKFWNNASRITALIEDTITAESIDPDNVVVYSYWLTPSALAACFLKKRFPGIKAVSRCHGWDVYFERNQLDYLPLRGFLFANLDKVYCISGHGASYLDAKTRFKFRKKMEVRPLGTPDPEFISPCTKVDERTLRMVSCSWMVALKRLPLIIDTMALLSTREPGYAFEWTHLGGGDDWEKITAYAEAKLGGLVNVKFKFPGSLDNSSIFDYYRESKVDLFVSASEWEGLPVSMMEAAAFGIPIVATDVGGVSEVVVEGCNGLLVPRDVKPADFADIIQKFNQLSDCERNELRQASREVWSTRFNADQNFSDWANELVSS